MKVSELKAIINRFRDDDELVIASKTVFSTIGTKPSIPVKSFTIGFDWERGQVIINPEVPVAACDEEFEKAKKTAYEVSEALGFLWMAMGSKDLDDKQKIAAVKRILKSRGFGS